MLYALLDWLNETVGGIPGFGVFQYLSFRAALAMLFSLIITVLIGRYIINLLRRKQVGETIRDSGPATHKKKAGTPTMGGLIILAAIIIPTLLWADLTNAYVLLILFATLWMGVIGFIDDYIKVFKKNKAGLKGKFKIFGQVTLGLIVGLVMVLHPDFQGPMGRVTDGGRVLVNQPLQDAGFLADDVILRIDGREFSKESNISTGMEYIVERKLEDRSHEKITINIDAADTALVNKALYGPRYTNFRTKTNVPFLKDTGIDYSRLAFWEEASDDGGWGGYIIYILVVIFILTAVSNGVNITDGLDGLAAGTTGIAASTLAIFVYVSGNLIFADYLNIYYIPETAELFIYCAAMVGACIGFLWYNAHPAQVFMGDTGSLMLGGGIGVLALMVKKELLLPLICGVFLIENLSVIIQVSYFKYTRRKYGEGRRVFLMSPIHHHFEKKGLHEAKIVARFWIGAVLLAILAFVTLKLR